MKLKAIFDKVQYLPPPPLSQILFLKKSYPTDILRAYKASFLLPLWRHIYGPISPILNNIKKLTVFLHIFNSMKYKTHRCSKTIFTYIIVHIILKIFENAQILNLKCLDYFFTKWYMLNLQVDLMGNSMSRKQAISQLIVWSNQQIKN